MKPLKVGGLYRYHTYRYIVLEVDVDEECDVILAYCQPGTALATWQTTRTSLFSFSATWENVIRIA